MKEGERGARKIARVSASDPPTRASSLLRTPFSSPSLLLLRTNVRRVFVVMSCMKWRQDVPVSWCLQAGWALSLRSGSVWRHPQVTLTLVRFFKKNLVKKGMGGGETSTSHFTAMRSLLKMGFWCSHFHQRGACLIKRFTVVILCRLRPYLLQFIFLGTCTFTQWGIECLSMWSLSSLA